jgi:transposase-like protein
MQVSRRYSESFKVKVVEELESGQLTVPEVRQRYGITGGSTIRDWLRRYGNGDQPQVITVTMKSEQERIQELEKALADERLGNMLLGAQLRSYQRHVPDLKKKLNSKELKKFEENEVKIKNFL